ncbi:hypothetical protein C2S51_028969 [Perilla frutescens var. frutescens]|nr:hypothetical protein C2S51_028969 [Perilla frutescens var. frutescens]
MRKILVGKVFSVRVVNREALRTQVPCILQLKYAMDIEIIGDNIFVIIFASEDGWKHTLLDGPWNFFNSLMSFKEPVGLQNPKDIRFNEFVVWVQIHNLSVMCMNPITIQQIGAHVGRVERVDVGGRRGQD